MFVFCFSSIKQKQKEEEDREAQLDEIRKRREKKLAILRSKGIGGKKSKQTRGDDSPKKCAIKRDAPKKSAIERDALNIKSDVRKKQREDDLRKREAAVAREERSIKRVSFSEDLDEELDEEELQLIKNKKNFVIGKKPFLLPNPSQLREIYAIIDSQFLGSIYAPTC